MTITDENGAVDVESISRPTHTVTGTGTGYSALELKLTRAENHILTLRDYGIVDEFDTALEQLTNARLAESLARSAAATLRGEARKAATKVTEFSDSAVIAAAGKLPSVDAVTEVAKAVYEREVIEGHRRVFARIGELPAILTSQLQALSTDAIAVADKLGAVEDAQEAIERGVTAEWQTWAELNGTINTIRQVVADLRYDRILAGPRGGDNWAWTYRSEPQYPYGGPHLRDIHHRANRVAELVAGLWVPGDADEVERVRRGEA